MKYNTPGIMIRYRSQYCFKLLHRRLFLSKAIIFPDERGLVTVSCCATIITSFLLYCYCKCPSASFICNSGDLKCSSDDIREGRRSNLQLQLHPFIRDINYSSNLIIWKHLSMLE